MRIMPVRSRSKEAAAAIAWRRIFDYIVATAAERVAILDRLEGQGLARRVAREGDRRVKAVVLTPKGKRMRGELVKSLYTPPRDLLALSQGDLEALSAAASKLPSRRPLA